MKRYTVHIRPRGGQPQVAYAATMADATWIADAARAAGHTVRIRRTR